MIGMGRVTFGMTHVVALVRLTVGRRSHRMALMGVMVMTAGRYSVAVPGMFGRFLSHRFGGRLEGFLLNRGRRFVMVLMIIHGLLLSY
jgi:hypothetical protein